MKWTEQLKTTDSLMEIKNMAIEQMKAIYPNNEDKDGNVCFKLPDGLFMRIWVWKSDTEYDNALGMEYGETSNLFPDDGDLYYPADYNSFDELFNAMLEETRR